MLIRKTPNLTYADITPKSVYLDRRKFLRAMGIVGATAATGAGLCDLAWPSQTALAATKLTGLAKSPFSTTEKQNTFEDVTHYNNF
ncbi:MAG: protein-methionine-sulfoxide reductase catalytic subunit MsrP, partial [Acidobacteria bacterium]